MYVHSTYINNSKIRSGVCLCVSLSLPLSLWCVFVSLPLCLSLSLSLSLWCVFVSLVSHSLSLYLSLSLDEEVLALPEEPDVVAPVAMATVDLHRYTPLGGVYYCDVFRLPPQATPARGWELRQVEPRPDRASQ